MDPCGVFFMEPEVTLRKYPARGLELYQTDQCSVSPLFRSDFITGYTIIQDKQKTRQG